MGRLTQPRVMDADRVDIEFQADGPTATFVVLNVDGQAVRLAATYLSHPLGNLLRAALIMAVGGERAECVFEIEPDRSRLELARSQAEQMQLTIWHVEVWDSAPEKAPPDRKVFEAVCTVDAFAHAVERAAARMLETYGPLYRETWLRRFPGRALDALRAALAAGGPSADRWAPPTTLPAWE